MAMVDYWKSKKVLVTGGDGFLGKHLVKSLKGHGAYVFTPGRPIYDLRRDCAIDAMFSYSGNVDVLFNLAANVGGIGYNQAYPYDLFYDNAIMGIRMIHTAIKGKVKKFVQIGTTCSYPERAIPPFETCEFWNGYPEETNAPYGIAKKILLTQLQTARKQFDFNGIYLILANLYGPGDNFDDNRSHVIPAMIKKFLSGELVELWGTGSPTREFLYVEDAVKGILLAAEKYNGSNPLNLGSGKRILIAELAQMIARLTDYDQSICWDHLMPDGQLNRLLYTYNTYNLIGWEATTSLEDGLKKTIEWYKEEMLCLK